MYRNTERPESLNFFRFPGLWGKKGDDTDCIKTCVVILQSAPNLAQALGAPMTVPTLSINLPFVTCGDTMTIHTPTANGIIGINGEVYEPVGKIQLAHVLSLSPEEVSAWQDYYANNHLQQPFAQVWEPVIPWNQEQAVTRYKNKLLTRANRNALKKALEFAGISMRSEVEDLGYNYREGKHEFANHGQLHFDQFFSLEFELYDGDLLLGDGRVSLCRKKPSANVLRGMNAVLAQLDFAIARDAAAETSEAELVKLDLTHFTLAQINELINIATANKSTACTAYLLNLKNERFPQYNALDHLVLDW